MGQKDAETESLRDIESAPLIPLTPRKSRDVYAWRDISYQVQTMTGETVDVLRDVWGQVPSRTMSALLGPSGAGKSSLFDVLLGVSSGAVYKGRIPDSESVGYVTQEIALMNSETAADVMWFYAHLTLPRVYSREQKRDKIDEIMVAMDLADAYGTVVGGADMVMGVMLRGLSSGQQRRLQVATQMLANPNVMILDEPTTGLDTTNALHVIGVIQKMCKDKNMIAICSLHQPRREIYAMLDHIILMAKGRTVYCGQTHGMIEFLEQGWRPMETQENPADFAMDYLFNCTEDRADKIAILATRLHGPVNVDGTMSFMEYNSMDPNTKSLIAGPDGLRWAGRVRVLAGRSWRLLMNPTGPINVMFRAINSVTGGVVTALFCLGVRKDDEDNVQYFISLQVIVILLLNRYSTMASMQGLHTRTYWYKERHQRLYHSGDAYVALQLVEAVISPAFAVALYLSLWITVGWGWHSGNNLTSALCLVMVLVQSCRASLLALTFLSRDAPVVAVTLMNVFGGCMKKYKLIPLSMQWLCFLNPYFYGFSGLMRVEFADYFSFDCSGKVTDVTGHCMQGSDILREYGFENFSLTFSIAMSFALWILYTVAGYYFYSRVDKSKVAYVEMKANGDDKFGDPDKEVDREEMLPLTSPHSEVNGKSTHTATFSHGESVIPPFLQYVGVTYKVELADQTEKIILHGATFTIKRDTMFGIMGPSGSGKTSLVRILGGWHLPGSVTVAYQPNIPMQELGYVAEDDFLPVTETVYEVLMFYSDFLLPGLSKYDKRARVLHVMEVLHLIQLKNHFVGGPISFGVSVRGISGGQKRRLSIGCSMLYNPKVLVLDEPTSGLDATVAFEVMKVCLDLMKSGMTIVCTIHQPRLDIFKMFDHMMFLVAGEVAYIGGPSACTVSFEKATRKRLALHENPADFILDNMKGMDAQDVRAMIIKMPPCEGPDVPEDQYWENLKPLSDEALQRYSMYQSLDPAREQQSFYQRMKLIIARIQLMLSRSWEPFICRTLFVIVVSIIFSMAYIKVDHNELRASQISDHMGLCIIYIITGLCISSASVPYVHGQRTLYFHEIHMGIYKPGELYAALMVVHIFQFASIISFAEFMVVFLITGLRRGVGYWAFGYFNFYVISAWAEILAVILGLCWHDVAAGHAVFLAVFLVIMFPSCGLLIATNRIEWPMKAIALLQPMHYTAGADMINLMDGRPVIQDVPLGVYGEFTSGKEVIEDLGYNTMTGNKYLNTLVVALQCVILIGLGWTMFSEEVRKSRKIST